MTRYYTLILSIFFIFFITSVNFYAHAEENTQNTPAQNKTAYFGLAMHGDAKYSAEDSHLDYVNPDAPKGGTLKMSAVGTFDTLNPFAIKGQAPMNMNLVYDRLMRRVWDEPFTLYPLIAKGVTIADDRSSVTFHLNPKAQFHDGNPITAEDVLFSYQTLMEHGRPNMRAIYTLIEQATIKDPHTITFSFGEGYDRETVMIVAMMPVLSKAWWQDREFDTTIMDPPLLNGPYRIKKAETGRSITYERVKDYWAQDLLANKGHYNFDTITYDYYRDDTIALESFKKGDLNLRKEWDISKWQSAYGDLPEAMTRYEAPHDRPERAHGFIFNMRRTPFDNRTVRKALALAFNHEWVGSNLFHNEFKRINSVYPNSSLAAASEALTDTEKEMMQTWTEYIHPSAYEGAFTPHSKQEFRRRLRQANALLNKAGWIVQDNVRVHAKTGAPMRFELILSTPHEEKIALTYKRALERLGIQMNIRMLDSAMFQDRKKSYDYDMIATYWQNSLSPGTEQMLYWSCKAAQEQARFNYAGICNPALNHFAQAIANAQDYAALKNYTHIIDRILMSEQIFVPLFYNGVDYIAHHKTINHPPETPLYGAVTESWWFTPQTQ